MSSFKEGGSQTPVGDSQETQSSTTKPIVVFNLDGDIISNRNLIKNRCLALVKCVVGVTHDNWREVPAEIKDGIWTTLQNEFELPLTQRDNVIEQVGVQWRTWKKNIRQRYFGTTRESILALKDRVPGKEQIPTAAWNEFIERETSEKKLMQRDIGKKNRAKKTDVHILGRTSYAHVEHTWERDANGNGPERVELFVHGRTQKKNDGQIHPAVADIVDRVKEVRSSQDETSNRSLKTDALTQVLGPDKKGRTRGVSSRVSKTKLLAALPVRTELQKVKADVALNNCKLDKVQNSLDHLLTFVNQLGKDKGKGKGKGKEHVDISADQTPQVNSSSPGNIYSTPSPTLSATFGSVEYYNIIDLAGTNIIAIGTLEPKATPGTLVHNRPLKIFEAKLSVIQIMKGMDNEKLWLGEQGGADTIGGVLGGFIVWPKHLIERAPYLNL